MTTLIRISALAIFTGGLVIYLKNGRYGDSIASLEELRQRKKKYLLAEAGAMLLLMLAMNLGLEAGLLPKDLPQRMGPLLFLNLLAGTVAVLAGWQNYLDIKKKLRQPPKEN